MHQLTRRLNGSAIIAVLKNMKRDAVIPNETPVVASNIVSEPIKDSVAIMPYIFILCGDLHILYNNIGQFTSFYAIVDVCLQNGTILNEWL